MKELGKYKLEEKLLENQRWEYWKGQKEGKPFLLLIPKGEVPSPSQKSMFRATPSLEKEHYVFPYREGKPLSEELKSPSQDVLLALRILYTLLEGAATWKEQGELPPHWQSDLIWLGKDKKIYFLEPGIWGELPPLEKDFFSEELDKETQWQKSLLLLTSYLLTAKKELSALSNSEVFPEVKQVLENAKEGKYKDLKSFLRELDEALTVAGVEIEPVSHRVYFMFIALALLVLSLFILKQFGKSSPSEKEKKLSEKQKLILKALQDILTKREAYIQAKHKEHKDMVFIPKGFFTLGRVRSPKEILGRDPTPKEKEILSDEVPARKVYVSDFWIDKYEVSLADYLIFASYVALTKDHKFCHPLEPKGKNHFPRFVINDPELRKKLPAVGVDWFDAYGFARFMNMSLPTEAEWEKAAKGTEELWREKHPGFSYPPLYPWGNTSAKGKCQSGESQKKFFERYPFAPFDAYPEGKSIYGVFNLAGNVWEWCLDRYDPRFFATLKEGAKDPWNSWEGAKTLPKVVVKGGSLRKKAISLRCSHRSGVPPTTRGLTGFRCVIRVKK